MGRRTDPEGFPALPLNGGAGAQSGGRGDKALLEVCVRARVWLFAVSLCATADYVADVTTKTPSLSLPEIGRARPVNLPIFSSLGVQRGFKNK